VKISVDRDKLKNWKIFNNIRDKHHDLILKLEKLRPKLSTVALHHRCSGRRRDAEALFLLKVNEARREIMKNRRSATWKCATSALQKILVDKYAWM